MSSYKNTARLLLLAASLLLLPAAVASDRKIIACELVTGKQAIQAGSPLLVRISVHNILMSPITLHNAFDNASGTIEFLLKRPGDGDFSSVRTPFTGMGGGGYWLKTIEYGDSVTAYELLWFSDKHIPVFDQAGKYEIKCRINQRSISPQLITDSLPVELIVNNDDVEFPSELLRMYKHDVSRIGTLKPKASCWEIYKLPESLRSSPALQICFNYLIAVNPSSYTDALPAPESVQLFNNIISSNDGVWPELASLEMANLYAKRGNRNMAIQFLTMFDGPGAYSEIATKARNNIEAISKRRQRIIKLIDILHKYRDKELIITPHNVHSYAMQLADLCAFESNHILISMITHKLPSPVPVKNRMAWNKYPFACALIAIGGCDTVDAVLASISDKRSESEIKVLTWVLYRLLGETEASQKLVVAKVNSSTSQAAALEKALEILPMKDGLIEEP